MAKLERIPPHDEDAEKSVLGAILIDKDVFFSVSEFVKADDFYSGAHREIFSAMLDLYQRSEPIDVVTVSDALSRRSTLETVGGRVYVATLSAFVPTTANAVQYAKIVAEKAMLRRLISAAGGVVEEAMSEALDSRVVLDHAEQSILEIAKGSGNRDLISISEVMKRNLDQIREAEKNGGEVPGLKTGFRSIDKLTNGFKKSDLIIVAARPSMGKTAFALNIAANAAIKEKKRVAIFSLEMNADSLGMRLLAMEARVDSSLLQLGTLSAEDWDSIQMASQRLAEADITIDESNGSTVMEIRNKCRRIAARGPIDLIIIDYLTLIEATGRAENRQQEVSAISRYLKQLAREMECPVIVVSQLSRAAEQRNGDKRPMLSDLRESGAIEQDADVVIFLYRSDYYKKKGEALDNTCEVIVAKQRNGQTGTETLTWIPRYTKFADMARNIPTEYIPREAPDDGSEQEYLR
ncbi:MAG: replicative DNA helicase [Firmicutes bacterium]|nr:replicative DNA helicase [Bacillota bacterium]MBQ4370774.1 replicative DNA helicase [Bacillota bacterium]